MMSPRTSIKTCFRKYAIFSGRASRSEYWWFYGFVNLLYIPISYIHEFLWGENFFYTSLRFSPLDLIVFSITIIPSMAVTARRLHDIGNSGWWQLPIYVVAVPLIAFYSLGQLEIKMQQEEHLALIVSFALMLVGVYWIAITTLMTVKSDVGENKYGPLAPEPTPNENT